MPIEAARRYDRRIELNLRQANYILLIFGRQCVRQGHPDSTWIESLIDQYPLIPENAKVRQS